MVTEQSKQILENTFYIGWGNRLKPDQVRQVVPPKIRKRLTINQAGLNDLATIVVEPEAARRMEAEELAVLMKKANGVNDQSGFGEAGDMIIRTAKDEFRPLVNRDKKPRASEPALLVVNAAGRDRKYKLLTKIRGVDRIGGLSDFVEAAGYPVFFLIHDDNSAAQMAALHGTMGRYGDKYELLCGTDMLHVRDIGNPESDSPAIRINQNDSRELLMVDPIKTRFIDNRTAVAGKTSIHRIKGDERQTKGLLKRIAEDGGLIWNAYQRVVELFGDKAIMEFRLYQREANPTIRRMQVTDVDMKF